VIHCLLRLRSEGRDAADKLALPLKADGFLAMLDLAGHIAGSVTNDAARQEEIFRQIARRGYWLNWTNDAHGYSALVVPVIWPELPPGVNTTGAGDATSATFAVMPRL